jgi:ABC-type transport system substrate-binding protein/DNA-binding SARP family transcriptional activator
VQYRILGPLEVIADGEPIALGPKPRALLAVLLLHPNEVVSVDRLADELWGERQPVSAAKLVQLHVSQLRKALADSIVTRPPGYLIHVETDELDVTRFQRLVAEARAAAGQRPAEAAELYTRALALWRGRALADVAFESFAANEAEALDAMRLTVLEERFDVELALGRDRELVPELEGFVAAQPLRERPRAQLMVALYRSGRRADALELYRETRRLMIDQLGLEPGEELKGLERAMLQDAPELRSPTNGGRRDGGNSAAAAVSPPVAGEAVQRLTASRLRLVTVAAAIVVIGVAVAVAGVFLVASGGREALDLEPNAIALLDPGSGRVSKELAFAAEPTGVVAANGALWASTADGTLSRAALSGNGVVERYRPTGEVTALAAGAGALWLVDGEQRRLVRFDPLAKKVVQRIDVGNGANAIAVGQGSVWVANAMDGTVTRVDGRSGRVRQTISVGGVPSGIAVGGRSVWVSDAENNAVIELDARSGRPLGTVAVGNAPVGIAASGNTVWVANTRDDTVSRIDGARGVVTTTITIRGGASNVAALADRIWVAGAESSVVTEIDATGHVRQVATGARLLALGRVGRSVAVATGEPLASHRGGTLRIVGGEGADNVTFDPATWWTREGLGVLAITNDGLVGYRRSAGSAGALVVPDLARSLPSVSDGGRTYTFRLRRGIRYSDGRFVRASDVRASFERLWRMRSGPAAQTSALPLELVGEEACRSRPRRCTLSRGVATDDATGIVILHLRRRNPSLLSYLATPSYVILPRGTPPVDGRPLPATGPYRISDWVPGKRYVLERNPHFRVWSAAAQPEGYPDRVIWRVDRVVWEPKVRESAAVHDVVSSRADLLEVYDTTRLRQLALRESSHLRSSPEPVVEYAWLNTRVPPFDRIDARRAVDAAVDRRRIVDLLGGPLAYRPACRLQPPGYPGAARSCLDPAGNLERARRLVQRSGTAGARVTVWATQDIPRTVLLGGYVVQALRKLGYRTRLRTIGRAAAYYRRITDARHPVQAGVLGWGADSLAGGAVLEPLLACGAEANYARFCDRALDAKMRAATTLAATDPAAAARGWAAVDEEAAEETPLVPLATHRLVTVVSRRVGNIIWHPYFRLLLDQLWVRRGPSP